MSSPSTKDTPEQSDKTLAGDATSSAPEWIGSLNKWNMEFAALYRKRLQEWFMLPLSVTQCRSPEDFRNAQAMFADTLMADYRSAAQKLLNSVDESADDAKTSATQAYAAALLKAQADAENILAQARAQAQRIIDNAHAQSEASPADTQETRVA
jgi:hypothetical protein